MLAPNCFGVTSALGSWKLLARELDILCPFGFNRMPEEDLAPEQRSLSCSRSPTKAAAHLWLDMEIFLFKDDMALYPRRPMKSFMSWKTAGALKKCSATSSPAC